MQVVLLERVEKLGTIGDVVAVKDGFARNYLLPRHKALRATEANIARFERDRASLEARNAERKTVASEVGTSLDGQSVIIIRQAGDGGQLYGSVSPRDIAAAVAEKGYEVSRGDVQLDKPIKALGLHKVTIALHAEVKVTITVNAARSPEEAERQARGEVIVAGPQAFEVEAEALFETPEVAEAALADETAEEMPQA